jgi:hypothetical protein
MPATDALGKSCFISQEHEPHTSNSPPAPPCTPAERAIVKSYGGWTQFMHSFGLKPWDMDDMEEAKRILVAFTQDAQDEDE